MLFRYLQRFCSSRLAWTIQQQLPDKNSRGAWTTLLLNVQICNAFGHDFMLLNEPMLQNLKPQSTSIFYQHRTHGYFVLLHCYTLLLQEGAWAAASADRSGAAPVSLCAVWSRSSCRPCAEDVTCGCASMPLLLSFCNCPVDRPAWCLSCFGDSLTKDWGMLAADVHPLAVPCSCFLSKSRALLPLCFVDSLTGGWSKHAAHVYYLAEG